MAPDGLRRRHADVEEVVMHVAWPIDSVMNLEVNMCIRLSQYLVSGSGEVS
jgi:hypothetical protein